MQVEGQRTRGVLVRPGEEPGVVFRADPFVELHRRRVAGVARTLNVIALE